MTTRVSAVAFDLGGVLIDWNPRYLYRQLLPDEAAMEQFLAEVCTREWNRSLDSGASFADRVADLVAVHPDQAELIEAYRTRWGEMLGPAFEGTVAIMREIHGAGYPTYALSNWSHETFPLTRGRFPFLEEFDGILISGEARLAKPDEAFYRLFLERFGLEAGSTVFIDDWDESVAAARNVGMIVIPFEDPEKLRRDLRELGLPVAAA